MAEKGQRALSKEKPSPPPTPSPPASKGTSCKMDALRVDSFLTYRWSPRNSPPSPPKVAPPRARSRLELPVLKKRGEEETRMENEERRRSTRKEGSILIFSPPNSGSYWQLQLLLGSQPLYIFAQTALAHVCLATPANPIQSLCVPRFPSLLAVLQYIGNLLAVLQYIGNVLAVLQCSTACFLDLPHDSAGISCHRLTLKHQRTIEQSKADFDEYGKSCNTANPSNSNSYSI